jgi:anionic cell wall polymer biosynthesis LytR-Cps2A-Psr (LCP) family protein
MRTWLAPLLLLFVVSGTVVVTGLLVVRPDQQVTLEAASAPAWDAVSEVIQTRQQILGQDPELNFGSDTQVNVLALGLDSRKEGLERHCDSIHLVTFDLSDWSILITSVPRGTFSLLPPGREYKSTDYYLANACSFGGLDYGVEQIEKVLGVKADYVVTVGFSQALGIFRALGLPTTETLQWLRHRQSYAIGDPQRSHNQAVFLKDTALRVLANDGLAVPFLHLLYSFTDSDLDFQTVKALYNAYRAADLGDRPDDIKITMKPSFAVADYHFDPDQADVQVDALVNRLRGRLSDEDLSLKTANELQAELEAYLTEAVEDADATPHLFAEQLWRQLDDDSLREELQYKITAAYAQQIQQSDPEVAVQIVTDYILEKQYYGLTDWEQLGKKFLGQLLKDTHQEPEVPSLEL